MPEGPELHISSLFINNVCRGRVFGQVLKSEISKNPEVQPPAKSFRISATSRGKEIKLRLVEETQYIQKSKVTNIDFHKLDTAKSLDIMFTFGMSGQFEFYEACKLKKHAHLNFFTCDAGPEMVLSFVDYRRFGRWISGADFSYRDRGPCVLFDYTQFRDNVLQHLNVSVFNKPICEVMLNQKYFNGIGNYLRAEILYRAKIPPFVSAHSVLEPLTDTDDKMQTPDILLLCHTIPQEVIQLESSWYDGNDRSDKNNSFNSWLKCYYQDGMSSIVDHNKRTIWYSGPLGPLAPKENHVRSKKNSKARNSIKSEGELKTSKKKATKRTQKDERVSELMHIESDASKPKRARQGKSVKTVRGERVSELMHIESDAAKPKRERQSKSVKTVRGERVSELMHIESDVAKPKRARQSKSVKTVRSERVSELMHIESDVAKPKRARQSKSVKTVRDVKQHGNTIDDVTEAVRTSVHTGRLTRGKIKQIVDTIKYMPEQKTKVQKTDVVKETLLSKEEKSK